MLEVVLTKSFVSLTLIAPWIPAHFKNGTYGTIGDGSPIAWLEANEPVKNEKRKITANLGS